MVYVHNVDYCPHTIKIATDIIDSLSCKLSQIEEMVLKYIATNQSLYV